MSNLISNTIRSIYNKSPSVPSTPAPAATPVAPTVDNSEEVKKQKALEDARQKRVQGLGSTDNTGGDGVSLNSENVDKAAATDKTLLGQ